MEKNRFRQSHIAAILFSLGIYLFAFLTWPDMKATYEYLVVGAVFLLASSMLWRHDDLLSLLDKRLLILAVAFSLLLINAAIVGGTKALARGVVLGVAFFSALVILRERRRAEGVLIYYLVASMISLLILVFYEYAFSDEFWDGKRLSLGWNPNVLAMLSFSVFASIFVLGRTWNVVKYVLSILVMIIIFFSGSRATFLATICSLCAYFFMQFRQSGKITRKHAMYLVLLTVFLVALLILNREFLMMRLYATSAIEQRLHVWADTLSIWWQKPLLGIGFGMHKFYLEHPDSFGVSLPYPYGYKTMRFSHSHNEFLAVLAETGIIGLLILLALVAYAFRRLYQLWRNGDNVAAALFIALLGYCIIGMAETMFMQGGRILWLLAIMAIAYALAAKWRDNGNKQQAST